MPGTRWPRSIGGCRGWAVENDYEFDGPGGKASLLDLFEGRGQLIVYRAFFEPGMFGYPDHACCGCSLVAAHVNAYDTILIFVSRAPQPDIARVKARMGWTMPWYTMTDEFDTDFGVDECGIIRGFRLVSVPRCHRVVPGHRQHEDSRPARRG